MHSVAEDKDTPTFSNVCGGGSQNADTSDAGQWVISIFYLSSGKQHSTLVSD